MSEQIKNQLQEVLSQLAEVAAFEPDELLVVGCSTSEIVGKHIGTASNEQVAAVLMEELLDFAKNAGVQIAIQCCEHLNRALVVELSAARQYNLEQVTVVPHAKAGGALAARAMSEMNNPVVVESLGQQGKAGIDIGSTLIGMHLRPVAVPVRTATSKIGEAIVVCARTRPKLIGGRRAIYP